jgi:hypothetical protein
MNLKSIFYRSVILTIAIFAATTGTLNSASAQVVNHGAVHFGMAYNNNTAVVTDHGVSTRFGAYYSNSGTTDYPAAPLLFVNGRAHYNVANYNSATQGFSTNMGLKGSAFVAYSFLTHKNEKEEGADLYFGAQTAFDLGASRYSANLSNAFVSIGPETGLHIVKGNTQMTFGGSVNYTGANCGVKLDNDRTFIFPAGAVGFMGVGRLAMNEKFYGKVFYAYVPTTRTTQSFGSASEQQSYSAKIVDLVLYFRVTEDFEITAECTASSFKHNGYDFSEDAQFNVTAVPVARTLNASQFSIGFVRNFITKKHKKN